MPHTRAAASLTALGTFLGGLTAPLDAEAEPTPQKYYVCKDRRVHASNTPPSADCAPLFQIPETTSTGDYYTGRDVFVSFSTASNPTPEIALKETISVPSGVRQKIRREVATLREFEFRSTEGWTGSGKISLPFLFSTHFGGKLTHITSQEFQESFGNEERSVTTLILDGNLCNRYDVVEYKYYREGYYSVSDKPNDRYPLRYVERNELRAQSHCAAQNTLR